MLSFLAFVVLTTTLLTELAARRQWLPYWITRKLLHIIAVGACAWATLEIDRQLLTWIVAGAEVILVILILSNQLMREESGRRAWGIIWFPLAFLVLLLSPAPRPVVAFAMWVLAICDPAATIVGKLFARKTYSLTGDPKSIFGNLAFAVSFILLALCFTVPTQYSEASGATQYDLSVVQLIGWPGIIGITLLLTIGESLGSKGLDNLIVPLLAAYLWLGVDPEQYVLLVPLLFAGTLFSIFMVERKSLTAGGALTATLLGIAVVLGSHSFLWLIPLLIFLLSSSLIGKLLPVKAAAGDAKQKQARDATQVLANGAVYGWFALFAWPSPGGLYLIFPLTEAWLLAIMAIATADTWSSEIGQYYKAPTYNLLTWKRVPPGLSGGVSLPGTLAGLAGATFLVGTCFWLVPYASLHSCTIIILCGFLGMLIDSV
ncbi:MAG: DUF92 domain-containing protein, partial [Bacteroidota bacterium]